VKKIKLARCVLFNIVTLLHRYLLALGVQAVLDSIFRLDSLLPPVCVHCS